MIGICVAPRGQNTSWEPSLRAQAVVQDVEHAIREHMCRIPSKTHHLKTIDGTAISQLAIHPPYTWHSLEKPISSALHMHKSACTCQRQHAHANASRSMYKWLLCTCTAHIHALASHAHASLHVFLFLSLSLSLSMSLLICARTAIKWR